MTKTKEYRDKLAEEFIRILEEKELDWKKEWNGSSAGAPRNGYSGYQYKGINRFYLNLAALRRGYQDSRWCTYRQVQEKGWKLKNAKGQGVKVEYWFPYDKEDKRSLTWEEFRKLGVQIGGRYLLRVSYKTVFNASLIEGIPDLPRPEKKDISPADLIGRLSEGMEVEIINDGGDRAFYRPSDDTIHLPVPECFDSEYAYNSTALHELAHSTGASKRLNRGLGGGFGTESYAFEELVAEISSCFMSAELPVEQDKTHIENHKAYVQSWIRAIREKPDSLIRAVQQAEKAASYMEYKAGLTAKQEYERVAASVQEVEEPAVAGRDNGKENFYDVAASEKMTEERKEQEQKMANKPEIGEERSGSNREEKIRYMAESVPDFGTEGREFEEDPVELWIGNRQSYLEGSLKGEWVSLPMDDKRLQEVMERIAHIHKDTRGGLAIMDKHCREDCSYLGKAVDEYTSIMDVNTVAGLIGYQSHPAVELYVSDRIPDISELANLLMQERDISYNPYSFRGMENLPDISAEEKLGYTVVENDNEFYDMLTDRGLADYIDYEAVGRDASLNGVLLGEEGYLDMKLSSVDIERYSLNEIRQSQEAYGVYDTVKEEYCRIGSDIMTFQSYEDASSAAKAMNEEISPKRSTGGLSRTLCALIERSGREGTYTIPAGELPRATLKLLEAECGREGLGIFISFGGPGADVTVREGLSGQYDMAAEGETRNSDKGKEIRPQQKMEAVHRL